MIESCSWTRRIAHSGPVRSSSRGEAAAARPRAIAGHERDQKRHEVQRVDVVVIAHAIAQQQVDPGDAREEQRRARRDADDHERAHRQHRRLERIQPSGDGTHASGTMGTW